MGLAASQVRLLSLTSRQHTIEYTAQKIQAQKLQLANESDMVYNAYMNALDSTKIQYKYVETDGSVSYKDATFNSMFSRYNAGVQTQYALEVLNGEDKGKFYVTNAINQKFGDYDDYDAVTDIQISTTYNVDATTLTTEEKAEYKKKYQAKQFANAVSNSNPSDPAETSYYENLYFILINSNGTKVMDNQYGDDYKWLNNMVANAEVLLHKWDSEAGDNGKGEWTEISISNDILLQQVSDEKELKKAEAVYEAETSRINKKDAQYDTLLSQTDTERNAVKTEMDSIKTVRNDNVDRAFKLFS